MAVTKIWNVKSHLQELIDYVGNVEKTTKNFSEDTIAALIEYGVDVLKTEEKLYVTPINCQTETAAALMNQLNKNSRSKSETIAYHAYQSATRS